MKLELKHLAPYLPYGLSIKCMGEFIEGSDEDNPTPKIFDLIGLLKNKGSVSYHGNKELFHYEDIFPILHPLSGLTDEQKETLKGLVNGSNIIKHHYVSILTRDDLPLNYVINKTPYCIIQKLQQWHFDIYGLIKEGLAININTL